VAVLDAHQEQGFAVVVSPVGRPCRADQAQPVKQPPALHQGQAGELVAVQVEQVLCAAADYANSGGQADVFPGQGTVVVSG